MNKVFTKYLRGDKTVWMVFILLCIISVIELYSASSMLAFKRGQHTAPIISHVVFLLGGATIVFLVHLIPYKYVRLFSYPALAISIILLIITMRSGHSANEATRWISIAGIRFQPSELAKLSLVIVVADFISRIRANPATEKKNFRTILIISGVVLVLILLENFSTAFILGAVVLAMMFIGRVSGKRLSILILSLFGVLLLGYVTVKAVPNESMPEAFKRSYTWVNRIDRVFEKSEESNRYEINDDNLQVQQGRIAIARGKLFGVMPGNSVQRDYLPHAYDDFIFSIIIEEMGLFGAIFVMILYLILLFRTGQIATVCRSSFPALLVTGLGMIITMQALVNMIVGSGLVIVTGQPLPLISRGGTSILITSVYFGIILGVIRQIKEENEPQIYHEVDAETISVDEL